MCLRAKRPRLGRMAPQHLQRISCLVHERIVSNENIVQWKGRHFQIPQHPLSFAGAKVQIYQALVKRAQKKNRAGTFAPARDLVALQLEGKP